MILMGGTKRPDEIASANFREVCMGAIAPEWLYRSSHPITNDERDFIIAEFAERAKIAAVLNLEDDERRLKQKAVLVPWYNKLFQEGCIIGLNMSFDFRSDQFGGKLNKGIKFIINHKGPYLIHCLQGIDRTGFFIMLLEMLMGAGKEEIAGDHMKNFFGRPGFEEKSVYYKREYSNFINVLRALNDGKSITNKNIPEIAEKYIIKNVGLIQSELDQLRLILSKKQDKMCIV
jgi:protein tyrosine/serine phosphatase